MKLSHSVGKKVRSQVKLENMLSLVHISLILNFDGFSGYFSIELVTTECHEGARALYAKKGFNLRQLYHKQILFSVVQILMFEYSYSLL